MWEMVQIWPNYGGGAEGRTLADNHTETATACAPLLIAQGVLENLLPINMLLSDTPR